MMKRPVKGIALDLEGNLIDLEPLHFLAHKITAESIGISIDVHDPQTFISRIPHLIGGPDVAVMREILELAILDGYFTDINEAGKQQQIHEMLETKRRNFIILRDSLEKIDPRPGALNFIQQAMDQHIPMAIGSVTERRDAMLLLKKSNLDSLFPPESVVLREDVTNPKPDPEVYRKTAERMGIDPYNQLVFEDSHNGIIAAREAGSLAIGVPTVNKPEIIERMRNEGAIAIYTTWKDINLTSLILEGNYPGIERK